MFKHDIASLSAQICFYAIFSLFPLLILVIYGASLLVPHLQIEKMLLHGLQPYYPNVSNASAFLKTNIESLGNVGARLGLISFVTLLWSATSAFIAVQQAMDSIFEITEQRSFFARRVVAFTMLILLVIVAILSSIALAIYPSLAEHARWWPLVSAWAPLFHLFTRILYPLSLFITCFVFYRFMPSRKVDGNSVLIGALISTVVLDLARALFVVYASHLVSYHVIYGGLTVVMLLVLWMYIAGMILLLGAEIAAVLDKLGRATEEVGIDG